MQQNVLSSFVFFSNCITVSYELLAVDNSSIKRYVRLCYGTSEDLYSEISGFCKVSIL